MKIMGIDEAGRGPVLGPMVLGCVVVDEKDSEKLLSIGVKDSKQLLPKKRCTILRQIQEVALFTKIEIVPPAMIDAYCHKNLLDLLEAEVAARLLRLFPVDVLYIDAPGKNGTKFARRLACAFAATYPCQIIAENKADIHYPVVSAASILAKVRRDEAILELHKTFGNFGTGYPGDKKTRQFLTDFYRKNQCFPSCARQSWSTLQKILSDHQASLI